MRYQNVETVATHFRANYFRLQSINTIHCWNLSVTIGSHPVLVDRRNNERSYKMFVSEAILFLINALWWRDCGLGFPPTELGKKKSGKGKGRKGDGMSLINTSLVQDVLYGGINPDIPGHGGKECAAYLPKQTMLLETAISTFMMVVVGIFGIYTFTMPSVFPTPTASKSKRFLLVLLCLVFGIEIGFKVCSRQVLYLLNPCHVITAIEVIISLTEDTHITWNIFIDLPTGCWSQSSFFCCS